MWSLSLRISCAGEDMTRTVSAIAVSGASDRTVRSVRTVRQIVTGWSADFFSGAMIQTRRRFNNERVAEQFAKLIDCDDRTARRYLAGERTPDGSATLAMLLDPGIGPPMLKALFARAENELSEDDYERFCAVMAEAMLRRFVRENNEAGDV